jgi:hypothetical protein
MFTQAQVKAADQRLHGVVMVGGRMFDATAGKPGPPASVRDVRVRICTAAGNLVTGAHPTITVTDPESKPTKMVVPVADMEGIGLGLSDYHYGNNVILIAGHHIAVTVVLNGQKAVFHITVGVLLEPG